MSQANYIQARWFGRPLYYTGTGGKVAICEKAALADCPEQANVWWTTTFQGPTLSGFTELPLQGLGRTT